MTVWLRADIYANGGDGVGGVDLERYHESYKAITMSCENHGKVTVFFLIPFFPQRIVRRKIDREQLPQFLQRHL